MAIYTLLVGINRYEAPGTTIGTLYGCENDVRLLNDVLTERYVIPPKNRQILLSEQATKRNIVAGFQNHLGQAGAGDTAIFYFSGHGSQEEADPRFWVIAPDHHNETLVCHDSRASEPYELADKELRYLIHSLSQQGVRVVTLIDSCHSGNATRNYDDEAKTGVRQSPGRPGIRPLDSYIFFKDPAAQNWLQDFSQMPEGGHIAISACRSDQLSKEVHIDRAKHGIFTYAFCEALKHVLVPPSYRNLVDAAGQKIKSRVSLQSPQLDSVGNLDIHGTFLDSGIQPVVYQAYFNSGQWCLNAGLPQGINPHARLQINDSGILIAVAVLEALHNSSRLEIKGTGWLDPLRQYSAHLLDPAIPQLPIAFKGDAQLVQALQQTLNQADERFYLEESPTPEYLLEASTSDISLRRNAPSALMAYVPDPHTGKQHRIPLPLAVDSVVNGTVSLTREQIALKLVTQMAKWQRTLSLVYTVGSMPEHLIELVIEQYDHLTRQYSPLSPIDDSFDLHYQQAPDGSSLQPRFKLLLQLNTRTPWADDVFVSLLYMDPLTGSVMLMTQAKGEVFRQQEKIIFDGRARVTQYARTEYPYTKRNGSPEINASIPDSLLSMGINRTTDYLKLFISNFELDVSGLEQPSLQQYLQSFYDGSRSLDIDADKPAYKSRTQTIALNIIKPVEP